MAWNSLGPPTPLLDLSLHTRKRHQDSSDAHLELWMELSVGRSQVAALSARRITRTALSAIYCAECIQ